MSEHGHDAGGGRDLLDAGVAMDWEEKGMLRKGWRENFSGRSADGVIWLTVALGAWGVLSGYAVFVLLWENLARHELLVLVWALLVAGVVGWMTEYLRERIDHGGTVGGMWGRLPVTILTLGLFELFISAWDTASEMGRERIMEAGLLLLGHQLAEKLTAQWALAAMAVLWVVEGAVLAGVLTMTLLDQSNVGADLSKRGGWKRLLRPAGRSAMIGGIAGVVAGAVGLFLTVVLMRIVGAVHLMYSQPDQWLAMVRGMGAGSEGHPASWVQWVLFKPVEWLTELWRWGAWGPLLTVGAVLGIWYWCKDSKNWWPVAVLVGGLGIVILSPVFSNLGTVLWMMLMAALVWAMPGLCLGFLVPMLRGPASLPRVWGGAAFGAAGLLAVISLSGHQSEYFVLQWGVIAVVAGGGVIFWKGGELARYWPLAALTMATYVGMVTALQQATFEGVLHTLIVLTEKPNVEGAPAKKSFLDDLDNLKNFRYQPVMPFKDFGLQPATRRKLGDYLLPGGGAATGPGGVDDMLRDQLRLGSGGWDLRGGMVMGPAGRLEAASGAAEKVVADAEGILGRESRAVEDQRKDLEKGVAEIRAEEKVLEGELAGYGKSGYTPTGPEEDWPDYKARETLQRLSLEEHKLLREEEGLEGLASQPAPKMSVGQTFELSVTGSLAFWVTVGLLVGWSSRTHQAVLVRRGDGKRVCFWGVGELEDYHDKVFGRMPVDDRELFERLCLELMGGKAFGVWEKLRGWFMGFEPGVLAGMELKDLEMAVRKAGGGEFAGYAGMVIGVAKKFSGELGKKGAVSSGRVMLEAWKVRAGRDPVGFAAALRKEMGLGDKAMVGTFLLSVGMVEGGHFGGCECGAVSGETTTGHRFRGFHIAA